MRALTQFQRELEANDGLEVVRGKAPERYFSFNGDWDSDIPQLHERLEMINYRAKNPRSMSQEDWALVRFMQEDHLDEITTADVIDGLFDDSDYSDGHLPYAMLAHTITSNTPGANPQMGQLDRMISESGYHGNSVSFPRLVHSDGRVYWQRQEWLVAKCGNINLLIADKIINAWKVLNYTEDQALHDIDEIKRVGDIAVVQILNMATAADHATPEPEEEDDPERKLVYDDEGDVVAIRERVQVEELGQNGMVVKEERWVVHELTEEEWQVLNGIDDGRDRRSEAEVYIPIGVQARDFATPWIRRQPEWFQDLVHSLPRIQRLDDLERLGKDVFDDQAKLNRAQAGVFWSVYKARRKVLVKRMRPSFRRLAKWIAHSKRPTGYVGKELYKCLSENRVVLTNNMKKALWKVYNHRKGVEQNAKSHDRTGNTGDNYCLFC